MNNIISQLRKKYSELEYKALTETERLILALSYSEKGGNAEIYANKIIDLYGSLHAAADSDALILMHECDITMQSAVLLSLIPQIQRRREINKAMGKRLNTAENAKKYFLAYLQGRHNEIVVAVAVNKKFKIITTAVLGYGSFSDVKISARTAVEFAIKYKAPYIFIAHCHPKAPCLPSEHDIEATRKINYAIAVSGAHLVDHIVTGTDGAISIREYAGKGIFDKIPDYETDRTIKNK